MTVFPIPIVNIEVKVAAGVVKEVGITAEFPTTIWIARASPKARAIPKTTAVKIPERTRLQDHTPDSLPASGSHSETGFTIITRNRTQAIRCHKGYGRQNHDKEDGNP